MSLTWLFLLFDLNFEPVILDYIMSPFSQKSDTHSQQEKQKTQTQEEPCIKGACYTFLPCQFPLPTCNLQKNPALSSLPSLSLWMSSFLPFSDFFIVRQQEAAFCVCLCVVLCRPLLIGPCKAGNYDRPGRDVSGLSLSFLRNFQRLLIWNCPRLVCCTVLSNLCLNWSWTGIILLLMWPQNFTVII